MYKMKFDKYVNNEYIGRFKFTIEFELDGTEEENIEECLSYYCDCRNYDWDFDEDKNIGVMCDRWGSEIELKNIEIEEI